MIVVEGAKVVAVQLTPEQAWLIRPAVEREVDKLRQSGRTLNPAARVAFRDLSLAAEAFGASRSSFGSETQAASEPPSEQTVLLEGVATAAKRLAVTPQTVRNWLRAGKIAGRRVGARWLVEVSAK